MSLLKMANDLTEREKEVMPSDEQRSVDSYYDNTPSSAAAGSVVGTVTGTGMGITGGLGVGRGITMARAVANNPVQAGVINAKMHAAGYTGFNLKKTVDNLPSKKKILGVGAAVGALLGALDGSYRGAMTGVGMNDRQYLMEENISPENLVHNSRMAAMNMNSSGGRISNMYNERFGKAVGSLRRMTMDERKDKMIKNDF